MPTRLPLEILRPESDFVSPFYLLDPELDALARAHLPLLSSGHRFPGRDHVGQFQVQEFQHVQLFLTWSIDQVRLLL